jgi:hypothetical protein
MVNLKAITFAVAGFAGVASYDRFDSKINYEPVQATVVSVAEICRFEKREGPRVKTLPTADCASAMEGAGAGERRGYRLEREFEVSYRYVSPADLVAHTGRTSLAAPPDAQPPHVGDAITVRASKWRPEKTRTI